MSQPTLSHIAPADMDAARARLRELYPQHFKDMEAVGERARLAARKRHLLLASIIHEPTARRAYLALRDLIEADFAEIDFHLPVVLPIPTRVR